ncbi:uncharacterized protein CCOS01_06499 [Colletotrichum costaricense]|uniref:Uncharacterized protein n=1 Tax=Colletotrichum costaricense TaxID=1209916 RepID=A0AAI9YYJ8_9PEZI|nr:uncharacterized protein CCOS01_06499 [Colletotrichum costaricense]KAK1528665.1 hypothetical protein CCOS01_06499 [Colletotrichum costaricense]
MTSTPRSGEIPERYPGGWGNSLAPDPEAAVRPTPTDALPASHVMRFHPEIGTCGARGPSGSFGNMGMTNGK